MIALGVLAVGLTSALALFAAAAGAQKRAVDRVTSGMVAASAIAEAEGAVTAAFDERDSPLFQGSTETRVLVDDRESPDFPGYRYDLLLTPLDPQERPAQAFCAEAVVRWSEKGRAREATFTTVVLRRLAARD